MNRVISVALIKLAKEDIKTFGSGGAKARLINAMLFKRDNQIFFSFLLIYFEHESLWHHCVPELDF